MKKWKLSSKLFLPGNSIRAFIDATNEYSLSFAQTLYGEQKELIKYLNKKEKELKV